MVYRNRAETKLRVLAKAIAEEHQALRSEGKGYLFWGLTPDTESVIGHSFHSIDPSSTIGVSNTYGTNTYRLRHCPSDVLNCLPAKPSNVSRQAWIEQKSNEYWRPNDFLSTLIQASQDYASWLAEIARSEGIPREKIYSQGVFFTPYMHSGVVSDSAVASIPLNNYSVPSYSIYTSDMDNSSILERLSLIKASYHVQRFAFMEYFDDGAPSEWSTHFQNFVNNTSIPHLSYVNVQNPRDQPQPDRANAVNFIAGIAEQRTDSVCGNGVVEANEQCDTLPSNYLNPYEDPVLLDGATCGELGFDTGTLGCANCLYDTSLCEHLPVDEPDPPPLAEDPATEDPNESPSPKPTVATPQPLNRKITGSCTVNSSATDPPLVGILHFLFWIVGPLVWRRRTRPPVTNSQLKSD
ncbi:MAG: hypothetical protein IPJ88_02120 [Myxococcales bacterium]|nr:MAG: hypothetical protein IPJ88_02120 [Myxococcales bacterium]